MANRGNGRGDEAARVTIDDVAVKRDGRLIDYDEAARWLAVSTSLLRQWVCRQRIPHVRLTGRTVRFEIDALRAWLSGRRVPSSPAGIRNETTQ